MPDQVGHDRNGPVRHDGTITFPKCATLSLHWFLLNRFHMKKRVRTEPPAALDLQSPETVYSGDVAPLNMPYRTIRHLCNRKHKYRHFRSFDSHFRLPKHKTALFCSFEFLIASTAAGVYDFPAATAQIGCRELVRWRALLADWLLLQIRICSNPSALSSPLCIRICPMSRRIYLWCFVCFVNPQSILLPWNLVEQFVLFFIKIKQISASKSAFQIPRRPIFSDSRIHFEYTDKYQELCVVI